MYIVGYIYEALEMRDGGKRYKGKGVSKAVNNINKIIAPKLKGKDVRFQKELDDFMVLKLDGTENEWGYPKAEHLLLLLILIIIIWMIMIIMIIVTNSNDNNDHNDSNSNSPTGQARRQRDPGGVHLFYYYS